MNDDLIKDAKKKLADINKTVAALDPSIRSAAFDILAPLYFEDHDPAEKDSSDGKTPRRRKPASSANSEKFFSAHDHDKPKDNVHLIAAWFYSQYGVTPLTKADLIEMGSEVGLTIPDRPDNTMRQAKSDGKNLYRQKSGGWQPTVNGEAYLKSQYSVGKGKKIRPTGDDE
ncbi:MAG TPA: hypothetical protein ENH10_02425 [Bacteroidetes bacterium]|nr:hypothetical protein [Bacteroidota bacterium]HEX03996.1 hypothetical protein [Bacteroidota bacterium]